MLAGLRVDGDRLVAQLGGNLGAQQVAGALEADVLVVVTDLGLGRGREDRLGELARVHEARRQRLTADGPLLLVLLEARAGEVAAHDALDGEHLGLLDEHEASAQVVGVGCELLGQVGHIGGDEGVADRVLQEVEPEERDAREDLALGGDFVGKDVVKCGDAVGRDHQQLVAEVVEVTHLALRRGPEFVKSHGASFHRRRIT